MLAHLAGELILLVCGTLPTEGDVNALARCSRRFYGLLNDELYLRNARNSDSSALAWAITNRRAATAQKAVPAWAKLLTPNVSQEASAQYMLGGHISFIGASQAGCKDIVELMTATGLIDVNWWDPESGRTALGWAAHCRHSHLVEWLTQSQPVLLDVADSFGSTPLSLAAQTGDLTAVRLLLETGKVDVNYGDKLEFRTPLSWASFHGRLDVMVELMAKREINLECRDVHGWTPLTLACRNGHAGAVELLLATAQVDINSRDRFWGRTPLIWAILFQKEAAARVLLRVSGVAVNATDIHGHTALSLAIQQGAGGMVKLLLDSGKADLNAISYVYGRSPLRWRRNTHRATVNLLPASIWPLGRSRKEAST